MRFVDSIQRRIRAKITDRYLPRRILSFLNRVLRVKGPDAAMWSFNFQIEVRVWMPVVIF